MTGSKQTAKFARQALIVLGMHRSGTSALTGTLELLGCQTPRTQIAQSEQNQKGFFEARPIARLNDRLLSAFALTWDTWAPMPQDWLDDVQIESMVDEAKFLLKEEFGAPRFMALKDPRICRVFPFWARVLEDLQPPLVLHIHRHPLEVAQSLRIRNGFDPPLGLMLWLTYVLSAEVDSRGHNRCFIEYDQLLKNPVTQMAQVQDRLGLRFPNSPKVLAPDVSNFLNSELRHHKATSGEEIPALIGTVFETFQKWALQGEDPQDYTSLDRASRLFDSYTAELIESGTFDAADNALPFQGLTRFCANPTGLISEPDPDTMLKVGSVLNGLVVALGRELNLQEQTVTQTLARLNESLQVAQSQAVMLQNSQIKFDTQAREIAGLEQSVAQLESHTSSLIRELDKLHQLTSYVDAERQAMLSSTSWRLTAPLRRVGRLFKGRRARRL